MYKSALASNTNSVAYNVKPLGNNVKQGNSVKPLGNSVKPLGNSVKPVGNAFCRVCMNVGKTEQEYRSHYTKNASGTVLCPTILNTICTYCKNQGHFKKECPSLKLKALKIIIPRNEYNETVETEDAPKYTSVSESMDMDIDIPLATTATTATTTNVLSLKRTYTEAQHTPMAPSPPFVKKRRNIFHNWADEEYWSDSNEEFK